MKRILTVVMCLVCFLASFIFTAETKAAGDGPVIELFESSVDIGIIPDQVEEITGQIIIFNKGTEDLKILKVTGTCSCFKGYEGSKVIKPGEDGLIYVYYDKNEIPKGKITRTATLTTNDPAKKQVTISFNFIIPDDKVAQVPSAADAKKVGAGPVAEILEPRIVLGSITDDVPDVVGPIVINNKGTKDLEIINVTGTCSCFKGYEGDKVIKPGAQGVIQVLYDKSEIPAGTVTRTATITTNDPANKAIKASFTFTIVRDANVEEVRILRSEVTSLRKELHMLRSDIRTLAGALKGANLNKPAAKKTARRTADTKVYDVTVGKSPILGAKDALVTITEFTDLQCPYCIREYPKIKEVLKAYEGKVRLVFKHRPLAFHQKAKPAHAAVQLALQEKGNDAFWKMHDMIMAEPKKLDIADLRGYAEKLGLDLKNFDKTMADKDAIDKLIAADDAEARKCLVRGTPTVMINGLKLASRDIEDYKARIDGILAKSAEPKAVTKK